MNIEDFVIINKPIHDDEELMSIMNDFIFEIKKNNLITSKDLDIQYNCLKQIYKMIPSKIDLRRVFKNHFSNYLSGKQLIEFNRWLIKKIMRSESGVLVVTVVVKPGKDIKFSCPEKCAYCPTETDLEGNPTQPKSYISTEPAMLRALRSNFDIKNQVFDRLTAYYNMGNFELNNHKKKIEVIISGGTWDVLPWKYRNEVINDLYYAFNVFIDKLNGFEIRKIKTLEEEIKENELADFGVVGLTIETRPDYITKYTINDYLKIGVTRVQIGVQHFNDDILKLIKRGCTTKHTIDAIRLLKGVGLKVVVHLMPDLPGSNVQEDFMMFYRAIKDPALQFDDIKIYPCAVVKSSTAERLIKSDILDWYDKGIYKPYSEVNFEDLVSVCEFYKRNISPWTRIQRLVRDIPVKNIEAGYKKVSNLRQVILDKFKKNGYKCNCIRCMEIKNRMEIIDDAKLVVRQYCASEGLEYHISIEVEERYWTLKYILYCIKYYLYLPFGIKKYWGGDLDNYIGLIGFLRLRIDPNPGLGFVNELEGCGLIRELHVYGKSVNVGELSNNIQHKGYGQYLLQTAENIVKSHNLKKVAIIAGVGTREYYKNKANYDLLGAYMIKYI
jgi:ELP3 family radical SAM enzyme/protein acetyltransferase